MGFFTIVCLGSVVCLLSLMSGWGRQKVKCSAVFKDLLRSNGVKYHYDIVEWCYSSHAGG